MMMTMTSSGRGNGMGEGLGPFPLVSFPRILVPTRSDTCRVLCIDARIEKGSEKSYKYMSRLPPNHPASNLHNLIHSNTHTNIQHAPKCLPDSIPTKLQYNALGNRNSYQDEDFYRGRRAGTFCRLGTMV